MKKKIVSMLLALTLVVSGIPVSSANATETAAVVIDDTVDEETAASEETETMTATESETEAVTTEVIEETKLASAAGDFAELEVSEDAKMVGSNGVVYDDVTYLSAKTVMALDEETQNIYYSICDEIATYKESGLDIQDVVIAVDAEGNIYCSSYIPMTALDEIQTDMVKDITDPLDATVEESATSTESSEDIVSEEENTTEATEVKETEESPETETTESKETEESSETETTEVRETEESSEAETTEVKETEESLEVETTEVEETEESSVEETTEELTTEEETTEEFLLTGENLDLLPVIEEETFEEIETVKVDTIIDLGYGSSTASDSMSGKQFNSVLPKEDYFYEQLTSKQQGIYKLAKDKFVKGSNSFSYTDKVIYNSSAYDWEPVCHAVSALILAYPDKTDWMAKPGGLHVSWKWKRGSSTATYTVSYDKSKFYSGSLDSKAKTQIQKLANEAQQYAADNCPNSPVYGIVKYYDNWLCENNYYEDIGTQPMDDKTADALVKAGYMTRAEVTKYQNIYYNCHSAYGALLNGYAVCESYAKALSRLLDAVGIPNFYVVGYANGNPNAGHAWNYVQMPNEQWYMIDSTWNDPSDPSASSNGKWFLVPGDSDHTGDGLGWTIEKTPFKFEKLATSRYKSSTETITLTKSSLNLIPKKFETLTLALGADYIKSSPKTWTSSNEKVAKVDKNGKVTAVAPGTATITLAAAGMTATCKVTVNQVKNFTVASTNKNNDTLSFGIKSDRGTDAEAKSVVLNVDMGNSPNTAKWLVDSGLDASVKAPEITYSNKKVDVATASITSFNGNQIALKIKPNVAGSTNITVAFAGKKVTLKVSVGKVLSADWFQIDKVPGDKIAYTGKAVKPKVTKTTTEKVSYKVTYLNNTNAGTATVKIIGTGSYGGEIVYNFKITPLDITNADFSKALKSKAYDGSANPPATTVKFNKKTLKVNKDYKILYNGKEMSTVPAGTYKVSIVGIGNYTGTVNQTQDYTVTKNTIAKVSVALSSTKYTGAKLDPVIVKIGKNVLPASDYTVEYHQGSENGSVVKNPLAKGKYVAVVTVKGNNLENTAKKTKIVKSFTVK